MITRQQDIPENWRRITLFDNIIGGQDWELMSRATFKDVGHVSSSRSTDNQRNLPSFQWREPLPLDPYCSMDLITDLPSVKGHDSILVVVDQGLTKGIILIPCSKTITAEKTVQLLLENLYKRFGLPDKIISDWGPQFASKAFIELLKLLGIKLSLSTTYHPQTDGTTERVNQEIEVYLVIYCASHPEEWLTALHVERA